MIDIDGTALPLEPGKRYLLIIKDGEVPRHVEHSLGAQLYSMGILAMVLRVRGDVNNVRLVQVDPAEGPIKVHGDVEIVTPDNNPEQPKIEVPN